MIVGIACGIQKRILIFNTSENLLHDPIYVVDPNYFDVMIEIDDSTPVVVAYNNYHYESLHQYMTMITGNYKIRTFLHSRQI